MDFFDKMEPPLMHGAAFSFTNVQIFICCVKINFTFTQNKPYISINGCSVFCPISPCVKAEKYAQWAPLLRLFSEPSPRSSTPHCAHSSRSQSALSSASRRPHSSCFNRSLWLEPLRDPWLSILPWNTTRTSKYGFMLTDDRRSKDESHVE